MDTGDITGQHKKMVHKSIKSTALLVPPAEKAARLRRWNASSGLHWQNGLGLWPVESFSRLRQWKISTPGVCRLHWAPDQGSMQRTNTWWLCIHYVGRFYPEAYHTAPFLRGWRGCGRLCHSPRNRLPLCAPKPSRHVLLSDRTVWRSYRSCLRQSIWLWKYQDDRLPIWQSLYVRSGLALVLNVPLHSHRSAIALNLTIT